jgi:hypothetical protein
VLAGVFVWLNRGIAGLPILAAGAGSNAFCIAMNGGQMPAEPAALAAAGLEENVEGYVNSGVVEDPRFAYLGDVFSSPSWLPLQNVYSLGDLLILAGAIWLLHSTCGTAPALAMRQLGSRVRQLRAAWALTADIVSDVPKGGHTPSVR